MVYIAGGDASGKPLDDSPGEQCPFCRAVDSDDETALVVARGTHCYAVLNLFPYNPGHLLLCPYRHVADYADLTADETVELAEMTQTAMRVIRSVASPHGFNIGMNQGAVAGRRHRRAPAPARRAAVERGRELPAGRRPHEGASRAVVGHASPDRLCLDAGRAGSRGSVIAGPARPDVSPR